MSRKRVSAQEMRQLRDAMVVWYPNCFVPSGATKRPLKIGIKKDLLKDAREKAPGLSTRHISAFLTDYVTGLHYFQACRAGAVRVGLTGGFSGFVDDAAAEYAKACIALLEAGKKVPHQSQDPRKPLQVGEVIFGENNPDPSTLSYEQWATLRRKHVTGVAAATSSVSDFVTTTLPTLEEELERLEYYQYAASMSNNFYYSDGSKAQDDARIADVKRRIRERDAK